MCSGTGRAPEQDGIGDLCGKCGGTGRIIVYGSGNNFRTPFMKLVIATIVVLLIFYLTFGLYLTEHRIDLTLSLIVLFAGHASVGAGFIIYFLLKSVRERG